MNNLFDLNIEQVLEHWGVEHAIREIIANALDEQILTKTKDIEIFKDEKNRWHIRDYGRGIKDIHFTQNENQEKLQSTNLIGKFGVGLKDALAVFHRKGINVEIDSKFAHITLKMGTKSGFDIETLHADFAISKNNTMQGTEFILSGVKDSDIEEAKQMFLQFSDAVLIERTKYGNVYAINKGLATIYVNGVQVAKEENFMFSYNITNINAQIKKALNRERSNVGRTAYSDTVKNILKQCKSEKVLLNLVEDLGNIMRGTNKDESSWVDVASYAAKTLDKKGNVVFLTPEERQELTNEEVEILKQSGKKIVLITDNVYDKLGGTVTTFDDVYKSYNDSFEYKFIEYENLSEQEKCVFDTKQVVLNFLKNHRYKTDINIAISETIRINEYGESTDGVYSPQQGIIIKRSTLTNGRFKGVLLHEFAHYNSGASDNTRAFENILTEMLGYEMNEIENSK
jgi:hypothetical protein